MSRNLDMENLSPNDIAYIRQRPLLHAEIIRRGYPDPLAEDFDVTGEDNEDGVNEETERLFSEDPDEIEFLSDEEQEDLEAINSLDDDEEDEDSKDRSPESDDESDDESDEEEGEEEGSSTEEAVQGNDDDSSSTEDDEGDDEGDDEDEADEPVKAAEPADYSEWNKTELKAEIDDRNAGREDEDKIIASGKNKGDLIAALEADDAS